MNNGNNYYKSVADLEIVQRMKEGHIRETTQNTDENDIKNDGLHSE